MPSGTAPGVSVETCLWVTLAIAAVASRFWNLGYRALHHDESIHTYYSWFFATGDIPYRHDPLSHGPFLFHANALIYLLFGGSNATSRYMPALAGVALVLVPWLLRGPQLLGRWGALAAGFFLLVSPTFLYYTRYIRHDPYTCLGALLLCISIFRYIEHPRRRWLITAFLTFAFMLTNHEIVFAIVLGFAMVLWGWLLLGRLRFLIPVHIGAVGLLGMTFVLRHHLHWAPLPRIPWATPTQAAQNDYYDHLVRNPLVISLVLIAIVFLLAIVSISQWWAKRQRPDSGSLETILGGGAPGSLERGVLSAIKDPIGLAAGAIASLMIFIGLFTTLFTNLHGMATSTYAVDGTVLYWLGQQDVRRGKQPWFYFVTESLQYEWLIILVGSAASFIVVYRLARAARGRGTPLRRLFSVFLTGWFAFLFLVLSWAGEKMPWLLMHILLPAALLGALLVDEIVSGALERIRWPALATAKRHGPTRAAFLLAVALVALACGWFFETSLMTSGVSGPSASSLDSWWKIALFPAVGLLLILVSLVVAGARQTANATLAATLVVLSAFQVHAGFRLAFIEGDTARDTLIYNTTSPDVTTMVSDLGDLSLLVYGDDRLSIGYDSCAAWPLTWYFKDLPDARSVSENQVGAPATLPDVVISVPAQWDRERECYMPEDLPGYTAQTYVLRWHEPESSIYRNFAIAPELPPDRSAWTVASNPHGPADVVRSIGSSVQTLADPAGQQRLFRLLMFRELPDGLNGYRYRLYIRNDLLPYYNDIRYGE